jgi:hypothetical protein
VQAEPEDVYRTTLGVVSRVVDELIVEAQPPRVGETKVELPPIDNPLRFWKRMHWGFETN